MTTPPRRIDWLFAAVLFGAAALAAGALPYAGGWHDGSRLATIEALVDYHTFAIDDTVYIAPRCRDMPPDRRPYAAEPEWVNRDGTLDKILVNGRFYSDKPMLPAVVMAGPYWVAQQAFGLRAAEHPGAFAYLMTLLMSGLPYVVAVAAVARTGRLLGVAPRANVALTASFAFATAAAAYTRQLNAHSTLLAVAALTFMLLADFPRDRAAPLPLPLGRLLLLGLLNGFGYALEQPTGGLLLAGTGLVLLYRRPRLSTALLYGLAALPCAAGHHGIGYELAGTFGPVNQNPEYYDYGGTAFDARNMTGIWNHKSLGWFLWYAARLLYGHNGFFSTNVPLFLLLPAAFVLPRRVCAERPECWLAVLWPAGVWLVYAALSTSYSGGACSVRWFVPFLAAAYYLLALLLRERPDFAPDLLLLSGWGAIVALEMWWWGPWCYYVYSLWPVQVLAPLSWAAYRSWRWRAGRAAPTLAAT
jgi:hypothetical protein